MRSLPGVGLPKGATGSQSPAPTPVHAAEFCQHEAESRAELEQQSRQDIIIAEKESTRAWVDEKRGGVPSKQIAPTLLLHPAWQPAPLACPHSYSGEVPGCGSGGTPRGRRGGVVPPPAPQLLPPSQALPTTSLMGAFWAKAARAAAAAARGRGHPVSGGVAAWAGPHSYVSSRERGSWAPATPPHVSWAQGRVPPA